MEPYGTRLAAWLTISVTRSLARRIKGGLLLIEFDGVGLPQKLNSLRLEGATFIARDHVAGQPFGRVLGTQDAMAAGCGLLTYHRSCCWSMIISQTFSHSINPAEWSDIPYRDRIGIGTINGSNGIGWHWYFHVFPEFHPQTSSIQKASFQWIFLCIFFVYTQPLTPHMK